MCARPGLDKHMWMCQNCRDAPSPNDLSTSSSYQCSYACWRQHKSTATSQRLHSTDGCASRQCRIAVGRAAQLLKKLFLIYRSHIYNNPLRVLEIRGDVLYVEDDYEVQPVRRGGNCYPIPQGLSEAHRNAVLLSLMCTDSADWMQPIVQWLLKSRLPSVTHFMIARADLIQNCVGPLRRSFSSSRTRLWSVDTPATTLVSRTWPSRQISPMAKRSLST